jgi:glycine hydroxymethyltransferase
VEPSIDRRASLLAALCQSGLSGLASSDAVLFGMLASEHERQDNVLAMIAASSIADPAVLICQAMAIGNVTTEGYPGERYHGGCEIADQIERLAIERAKQAFGAQFANVQPHSGTSANEVVLFGLLQPGDVILGLELSSGGHLSHGAKASVSGRYFRSVEYGLDETGLLDYAEVERLAQAHRPKLIIAGASSYPRRIDFARFRAIADGVGAYMLADISHIAGLVATGLHESPIDHAHFTTTSTYKQLRGPRGGLVLMGKDHTKPAPTGKGTLSDLVQRAVFPLVQGTPSLASIAAKACALGQVVTPAFRAIAGRIVSNAQRLAANLVELGYKLPTGGTDNHMLLIDVSARGLTGTVAERALEECRIIVNKNRIPGDTRPALVTSGIRIGCNNLAIRGMEPDDMQLCTTLIDRVLSATTPKGDTDYRLDTSVRDAVLAEVRALCRRFPVPGYPNN